MGIRGVIMNRLSHIEETRLRTIITDNPADLDARFRLAMLLEEKGRTEEAQTGYQNIIEEDPNYNQAYCRLKGGSSLNEEDITSIIDMPAFLKRRP